MRRSLASVLLGLSLVFASIAWTGFIFGRTALDPGRSDAFADEMLARPELRSAMVRLLADRAEALVPEGHALPREELEAIAGRTLDDPAVRQMVHDDLVGVHRRALAGEETDTVLHATALGTVARRMLVADRPELDPIVPQAPAVRLELPTAGLSVLSTVSREVQRATTVAAFIAVIGAVTALVVTRSKSMVLRRLASWAFGASAFWLVAGLGLPRLIATLAPSQGTIAAATAAVAFGGVVEMAIALALGGAVLLVSSAAWAVWARRRASYSIGRPIAV